MTREPRVVFKWNARALNFGVPLVISAPEPAVGDPAQALSDEYVAAGRPRAYAQTCLAAAQNERADMACYGSGSYEPAKWHYYMMLWHGQPDMYQFLMDELAGQRECLEAEGVVHGST